MKPVFVPFAVPVFLVLLLVLTPLVALFLWWTWRTKQRAIAMFVKSRLLEQLTVGVSIWRQQVKRWLLGVAVVLLLVSLARPLWGFVEEESRGSGLDIIVCFDVSRSMLATDLKPNRLQRARMASYDLVRYAKGDRLGLVAFAGSSFLQCPLALDPEAFRQSVTALDTEIIPEAGTALAEAIKEARQGFNSESGASKAIVVLTDGEDHEQGAVEAAREAAKDGIRVYTLGLGSTAGELLKTTDPYGNSVFVRDEGGNVVKSRLNESLLREVAEAGKGFYQSLQDPQAMRILYERGLGTLPKGEFAGGKVRQARERFQWPLALVAACLIFEFLLPEQKRQRGLAKQPESGKQAKVGGSEVAS
jgi:Ca-activated chloride channel family protein